MAERVSPPLPPPPSSSDRVSPPLPPPPPSSERVSPSLPLPPPSSSYDLPNPSSFSLHDPGSSQSVPVFQSGTYVVQVPKDQIYRVPLPENARYIEQHHNPQQTKRRCYCSCWRWCCSCCFVIVLILAIVIGVSVWLSFGLGKLKNPEFQVRHFAVAISSAAKSRYNYELKLRVKNPNGKSKIGYEHGGICSLFYRDLKLGEAKFPAFNQDGDNSKEIEILVKGLNVSLPEKMKNSMRNAKSKSDISFSLAIKLPTKMKTEKEIDLLISCNFVVDTLAKGTRVINQKCIADNG